MFREALKRKENKEPQEPSSNKFCNKQQQNIEADDLSNKEMISWNTPVIFLSERIQKTLIKPTVDENYFKSTILAVRLTDFGEVDPPVFLHRRRQNRLLYLLLETVHTSDANETLNLTLPWILHRYKLRIL